MPRLRFNLRSLLVGATLLPASLWFVWSIFQLLGRFAAGLVFVWFVFVGCGLATTLLSQRRMD